MNFEFKKIFVWFLFVFFSNSVIFAIELEYSIRPLLENEKSIIEVNCMFQGNESGITEILIPFQCGGDCGLYFEISELNCLPSEIQIENTDRPQVKKIIHSSGDIIQLSYHVTSREYQENESYFPPLIDPSYFLLFGHCIFIIPNVNEHSMAHIILGWYDFPSDWTLINSFGAQQKKQELAVTLHTFLNAVFVGVDIQLFECEEYNASRFVTCQENYFFFYERLTSIIQAVVEYQREFWNNFDLFGIANFLITALPVQEGSQVEGTGVLLID